MLIIVYLPALQLQLQAQSVLSSFKSDCVIRLLKKANVNAADVKSYRPLSNLSVVLNDLLLSSLRTIGRRVVFFQTYNQLTYI